MLSALGLLPSAGAEPLNPPAVSHDPRLELRVLVADPDLVTPIGCAAAADGSVYVVESHTHFRPDKYPGPSADRVKVFSLNGGPGKVWADGFRWAMNLAFDSSGRLLMTHRSGLVRLDPPRAGGLATPKTLLELNTSGAYPHNGIAGLACGPDGWIYVGLGENVGEAFTLRGSDGSTVTGPAGSGGWIFRCRADGSEVEGFARGFWNPFGLGVDPEGRLFAVDNDPDSRPPCRLLRVIEDGDYGFQFRHGRDGLSPFIAWDGELPGTLGMIAGVGEAPCSLLDARLTGLPADLGDSLLVAAAWDHEIERCRLERLGASFRSAREVLVSGGEDFRPVALAAAPDGSVVFTDWVKADYTLHHRGRLWRLRLKSGGRTARADGRPRPFNAAERMVAVLVGRDERSRLKAAREAAMAGDPFLLSASVSRLARASWPELAELWEAVVSRVRLAALLAARRKFEGAADTGYDAGPAMERWILRALDDADESIRAAGMVWAAEAHLTNAAPAVARALPTAGSITPLLAAIHAAACAALAGPSGAVDGAPYDRQIRRRPVVIPAGAPTGEWLVWLRDRRRPEAIRIDAARRLRGALAPEAEAALQTVAADTGEAAELRAHCLFALALAGRQPAAGWRALLNDSATPVAREAARALRTRKRTPEMEAWLEVAAKRPDLAEDAAWLSGRKAGRPATEEDWRKALGVRAGNAASGERVFYATWAGCSRCHRIEGLGGVLGPDLSTIGRAANPDRLLASILFPSRDIAPQFVHRRVETTDGSVFSGRALLTGGDGVTLLTMEGEEVAIPAALVRSNEAAPTSLMPEGLADAMTVSDLRDLLAYLSARR